MNDWISSNIYLIIIGLPIIGMFIAAIFAAGNWYGSVNTDRNSFKDFIKEMNKKIKEMNKKVDKILERLPSQQVVYRDDPVKLISFGQKISSSLSVQVWAESQVRLLFEEVKGMQPFEIFEKCEKHVETQFAKDEKLQMKIREGAYEHGIGLEQIQKVYQVELRDKLLQNVGHAHSPES